jgi:hypothetical protein
MESKHTPGPWWVVADEGAAQVTGFPCIEADNYTVVGLEGMYGDIDTDFANAQLIAAAPDMLEALKAARNEIIYLETASFNDFGGSCDTLEAWLSENEALPTIDAAIAKAEGRT